MSPFFILGSPRSGTTLLRLMLTSHPGLSVPPEAGFMAWLHPVFGASTFVDASDLRAFAEAVARSRKFDTWGVASDDLVAALHAAAPGNYAAACDSIYRLHCAKQGKPNARWGDKNNFHLNHIQLLWRIFPEAQFLHIVRDGRDVACSYREVAMLETTDAYRPRLPVDIDAIAATWARDVRRISTDLSQLPAGRCHQVRYEDLVASPTTVLRQACEWLGFGYDSAMLDFHRYNKACSLEPSATLEWKQRTLLPVDDRGIGRHLRDLLPREIAEFEKVAASELRKFGYLH